MKPPPFEYYAPKNRAEALELLAEHLNVSGPPSERSGQMASLVRQINLGFWKSLVELEEFLPPSEVEYALRTVEAFAPPAEHHESIRGAIQRLFGHAQRRPGLDQLPHLRSL